MENIESKEFQSVNGRNLFFKRFFDLIICLSTIWLWLPVTMACSVLVLVLSGRPVFYVSQRRVAGKKNADIIKFRTMVRNADRIVNRDTVPVSEQRFLNVPADSPLYTGIGKKIEKYCLTELPQLLHVLTGRMSLIGNRPLPENVIHSLKNKYNYVEDRFITKGGMTGPVQLIGRDDLADNVRLRIEILYSRAGVDRWSMRLDFLILLYTVLIGLRIRPKMTPAEVEALIWRYTWKKFPQDLCEIGYVYPIERRRYNRCVFLENFAAEIEQEGKWIPLEILDISMEGISFHCSDQNLPIGSNLKMRLKINAYEDINDIPVQLKSAADQSSKMSFEEKKRFGASFLQLTHDQLSQLEYLMKFHAMCESRKTDECLFPE